MTLKKVFGGSKSRSESGPVTIPRLPAVIPSLRTGQGSFLTATPTFAPGGQPGGGGVRGQDALTGLDINVGLSPEIQALRDETLAGRRGLISDVQGDIDTLRGIQNPFIQARVAPFVEERERAARAASRRGVTGPLAALATNPFTRQIADQQALATVDAQAAIRAGQQQIQSLLTDVSGEGRALLAQELELLGLSQQQVRDIIASQLERTVGQRSVAEQEEQRGIVPGVSDAFGAFFPSGLTKSGTVF